MYTGVKAESYNSGIFVDGCWEVTAVISESRKYENETEWETYTLSAKVTADTFAEAFTKAQNSVIGQYNDRLKETGWNSLFTMESTRSESDEVIETEET